MGRFSAWAERRAAPLMVTVAMLVGVMAYSVLFHPLLHVGKIALLSPSDLWSLAQSSYAMLHGNYAHVYVRNGSLTSPPAFEVALAPVIGFGELIGLSPHLHAAGQPLSMWFVLGPAALLFASTALFALDAVARHWEFSDGRRIALALVGGVAVANVAGGWGHPEDCVAVAFVVWAALALERDGLRAAPRAAWLLGLGIAFQPLAILGVAPVLARVGWRRAARLSWRLVLPSAVVLLPPLLAETHETLYVVLKQPFQPKYISWTPLTHLAPVIAPATDGGGPTRAIAILIGATLGIVVCRRRHDLATVLSMVAVAAFLRVLFETELNWYYLWPVPALCLVLALRKSRVRFTVCSVALLVSMLLGDRRVHHIATWWPALMGTLVLMLLSIGPSLRQWRSLVTRRGGPAESVRPVEFEGVMVSAGPDLLRE
jgi:hypothetical protein